MLLHAQSGPAQPAAFGTEQLSSVCCRPLDDESGTVDLWLVDGSISPGFPVGFAPCVRAGTVVLSGLLSDARPPAFDVAGAGIGKRSAQRDEVFKDLFEPVAEEKFAGK